MKSSSPTRVLGIDPGTRLCGWAVILCDGAKVMHGDNGVVVLDGKAPLGQRLSVLFATLNGVIETHRPDVAAVEGVFHAKNPRSALILGHARGVALLSAARHGLEIHEYTPQQVKKAVTGSGRADKAQVQQMITLRLGLGDVPQEDAADAVAVALCHAQHMGLPSPGEAPIPRPPRGGRKRADQALKALALAQQRKKR